MTPRRILRISCRNVILMVVMGLRFFLIAKIRGGFGGGNCFAHGEDADDAPCNKVIHHHRKEGRPFEDLVSDERRAEHRDERLRKGPRYGIDETREAGTRVRAGELQSQAEDEQYFKQGEEIPNDLRRAEQRLCGGGVI